MVINYEIRKREYEERLEARKKAKAERKQEKRKMEEERQPGRDADQTQEQGSAQEPCSTSSSAAGPSHGGAPAQDQETSVAPGFPVGPREWFQSLPTMAGTSQNLDHIPTAADMAKDASCPGGDGPSMDVGQVSIGEVRTMINEIETWIQEIRNEMSDENLDGSISEPGKNEVGNQGFANEQLLEESGRTHTRLT